MKVFILLVTLLALSGANRTIFSEILSNLQKCKLDLNSISSHHLEFQSASREMTEHPCECEVTFVKGLKEALEEVNSSSQNDYLSNIMDILDNLKPNNMTELKTTCNLKTHTITRSTRSSIKHKIHQTLIQPSINFIRAWNNLNCKKKSQIERQ